MYDAWLRSGNRDYANNVRLLNSSGAPVYRDTDLRFAVRPASSNVVNLKKSRIPRAFGSVARKYNAWLRSGFNSAGDGGYYLYSDGILYGGVTNRIFAVRPASSNAVNF